MCSSLICIFLLADFIQQHEISGHDAEIEQSALLSGFCLNETKAAPEAAGGLEILPCLTDILLQEFLLDLGNCIAMGLNFADLKVISQSGILHGGNTFI